MATTRLMPLHTGKGRTVGQAISAIIDYTENPQKTDGGRLITSWQCDSRIADAEFLFTKNQYIQKTGRVRGEDDVIAYHLRQSFVPGEITPEEANRLGCELAKRFTKGNHAYIVCTHIDKAHIHNHVIWNSTALSQTRKFRNFWGSSRAVRRLNDTICIENGYSIVENPKRHGKSYNKWLGDNRIQKNGGEFKMKKKEAGEKVTAKQGLLLLFAAVLVIVVCKIVFNVDTKTTLMLSGAIGGIICMIWGFKWEDIESKFAEGIKSTAMPIVLLIVIGMMVASWILSGTIPTMTYYGMKLLAPGQFLFLSCILCSVMSVCTGTSWGTVSTLGVALLGVAMGLGIPIEMTAGAIVVGSFFGDKMSPLSDSTVLAASCARVNLLDHVKHMYYSTVPAMLVSLVLFFVLGFRFKGGAISGVDYDEILAGLDASFNLSLLTLLPPIVVLVLVLMKKPAIPTFGAGIVVAFIIGIVTQGADPIEMLNAMSKGVSMETGIPIVNTLVNRGGIVSMLDTIGLILSAAIFAAPMRASGSVNAIFEAVKKVAKTPTQFMVLALIMQPVLLVATTSYFVTMPVTGELAADAMDEMGYSRLNLSRMMEDGGTVVCPLIPWGNTGAFITATLGVTPYEYFFYMPFIWLCFVFDMLSIVTGIGLKKADGSMVTPIFKRKAS